MNAFVFSLAAVFGAVFAVGCAGTAVKDDAAAAHIEQCPTCKAKLAQTGTNDKGQPKFGPVHDCPGCKAKVVAVQKDGKWVHEPADKGAAAHDCKMCKGQ